MKLESPLSPGSRSPSYLGVLLVAGLCVLCVGCGASHHSHGHGVAHPAPRADRSTAVKRAGAPASARSRRAQGVRARARLDRALRATRQSVVLRLAAGRVAHPSDPGKLGKAAKALRNAAKVASRDPNLLALARRLRALSTRLQVAGRRLRQGQLTRAAVRANAESLAALVQQAAALGV
jgi:hypothetical protein